MVKKQRKIVQIAAVPDTEEHSSILFVLCDDGTVWSRDATSVSPSLESWDLFPNVPQD